eukprot:CAMPEP_0171750484 /NCGR_PEP_ID=MMETSP0991-20121206/41416_1 /TAXON_ID=483369 /ORGANISM="non described non described, Strain CCMP2098" /LENGTH=93 /DNA_ID=CAMNT_0012351421 /DNA_START=61 /DNA_END=342 /DNA_ORIENTATION=+
MTCVAFNSTFKRKPPKVLAADATAGLFWLDQQLAKVSPKKRISKSDLLHVCREGGHRAGLGYVFAERHKIKDKQFVEDLVEIADINERNIPRE